MNLKAILWVVACLSICAVAAPGKAQAKMCHAARRTEATTKGFLILGENKFKFKKGTSPLIYLRNVQPVNGGLEVITWDDDEIPKRGVRMEFLECDVPASKYASPSREPFKGLPGNTPVVAGQLAVEGANSCLTVKDEMMSMEDCAKEDGDQLAAQWFHLVSNRLVYAGKNGSPLKAEVIMEGERLKSFGDQGQKRAYLVVFLDDEPFGGGYAMRPFSAGSDGPAENEASAGRGRPLLLPSVFLMAWMVR